MKIGILGSGIVARVLGNAFLQEGHEVMLGSRDTSKPELVKFQSENPSARLGSFSDAAGFGELVVLATGGAVALNAIQLAGTGNFKGKTVIDTTNPIAPEPPVNGVLKYFTEMNSSLMEKIQAAIPEARVVKAFNSVGNAFMYKPSFESTPTMFICGNDEEAKSVVSDILSSFGWETEDMGKVESARAIEPLCILWCAPGFLRNQWTHAFKLLKK
ncbi:MAG TPA: NAD(P)-binding domain-containing protein [Chitinophagaceae bacterium]